MIDICWIPLGFAAFYCIFMILDDDYCDCKTRVIIKRLKRKNRFKRNKGEKK